MKAIIPKKNLPTKHELNRAIRNAHETAGRAGEIMVERTTATWDTAPRVKAETKGRGGDYVTILKLTPEGEALIWHWLNEGTDVRYALMSPDFVAKTVPGRLDSGSGAGGVLMIDMRHPRPGIEARNWTDEIAKVMGETLVRETEKEMEMLW